MAGIARLMLYITPEMKQKLSDEVDYRKDHGLGDATLVAVATESFEHYLNTLERMRARKQS